MFTGSVVAIIVAVWILSSLAGSMIEFLPLEQEKFYGIIITVAFFFTPLIVILVAYGTIFHIARAHARGRDVSSFKKVLCYAIVFGISIDSNHWTVLSVWSLSRVLFLDYTQCWMAVIIVHVLVICSNLIKIIANVTKKHIYRQTCIMRSTFGNGLLTA